LKAIESRPFPGGFFFWFDACPSGVRAGGSLGRLSIQAARMLNRPECKVIIKKIPGTFTPGILYSIFERSLS
jgi:hypothetical protein